MQQRNRNYLRPVLGIVLGAFLPAAHAQTFTVLHAFSNKDGANPQAALIQDSAGNLFSTTEYGGVNQVGVIFKLSPGNVETVLHQFQNSPDGARPQAPLLADSQGNFYGTTYSGGHSCGAFGCGTVFKLSSMGKESVLHYFNGNSNSSDGSNPAAGLIADAAGNLYGTTAFGYNGTVAFEVTPSGTETILHSFKGGTDGLASYGPLVMDSAGNLWGMTSGGGSTSCKPQGCGVVFKLTNTAKGWVETITYRFTSGAGGSVPHSGLTYDAQTHEFYGTTTAGGDPSGCYSQGCGVLFRLDPTGRNETVLHAFTGNADGGQPYANVILDSFGNIYGTTTTGGNLNCPGGTLGCGTVFKVSAIGTFSTLYTFNGGTDGGLPNAPLLLGNGGKTLYGTATIGGQSSCQTQEGGGPGCGTVFQITNFDTSSRCDIIDYANGFTSNGLVLNGGAIVNGNRLELTDGGQYEARSAFFSSRVPTSSFVTDFTFQLLNPNADGFTFILTGGQPTVLGLDGGGLGYQGIADSTAIKFDLYNNSGEGPDSTGLYMEGASPTVPAINLAPSGIDLHSGHVFAVHIRYTGTIGSLTITDTVTKAVFTTRRSLPASPSNSQAYVGFTAGTGGLTSTQDILTWTYGSNTGCY